jgi:DNA damage-binding protein 1
LELLFEVQTRGAVHALDIMQMKNVSYYREGMGYPQEFLVASVNGMLNLYTFADDPNGKAGITLDFYCSRHCQTYIISISIHENFILSTDIVSYMKIHELQEKVLPNGKKDKKLQLVEVGRDFASRWITAAEFMSRDLLAVADYNCNLFILKKRHSDSLKIDRLEEVAQIHLGDAVNVIAPASNLLGSLNDFDDTEPSNSLISQLRLNEVRPRFIMGCTSGTLSVMCPLSETQFQFLSKIESALETIVYGHGNLSHEKWRSIVSNQVCHQAPDSQTNKCANFIDGDLIELVLSLSEQDQQRVAKRVQIDADDLIAIVQMLHQTH